MFVEATDETKVEASILNRGIFGETSEFSSICGQKRYRIFELTIKIRIDVAHVAGESGHLVCLRRSRPS